VPLHPPLSIPLPSRKHLHSLAAKLLWVGRVARPDILTNATNLDHISHPTGADARHAKDTLDRTLSRPVTPHYHRLDLATLRIDVYADYSGSSALPLDRRQLGYLMTLTNQSNRFSALYWASHKPHRVCRGSCAGELLALADAVAATLAVRLLLQEVLYQSVPLHAYTDSSGSHDMTTSFRDPTDMTSKNDPFMLRRALLAGPIAALHLVHGAHNPADALSKPTYARPPPNDALDRALPSVTLRVPTRSSTSSTEYRNSTRPPA